MRGREHHELVEIRPHRQQDHGALGIHGATVQLERRPGYQHLESDDGTLQGLQRGTQPGALEVVSGARAGVPAAEEGCHPGVVETHDAVLHGDHERPPADVPVSGRHDAAIPASSSATPS